MTSLAIPTTLQNCSISSQDILHIEANTQKMSRVSISYKTNTIYCSKLRKWRVPCPVATSVKRAATKPSMARRPFNVSALKVKPAPLPSSLEAEMVIALAGRADTAAGAASNLRPKKAMLLSPIAGDAAKESWRRDEAEQTFDEVETAKREEGTAATPATNAAITKLKFLRKSSK